MYGVVEAAPGEVEGCCSTSCRSWKGVVYKLYQGCGTLLLWNIGSNILNVLGIMTLGDHFDP